MSDIRPPKRKPRVTRTEEAAPVPLVGPTYGDPGGVELEVKDAEGRKCARKIFPMDPTIEDAENFILWFDGLSTAERGEEGMQIGHLEAMRAMIKLMAWDIKFRSED